MQPHSVFPEVKPTLLYNKASVVCLRRKLRGEDSIYILTVPCATGLQVNARRPQLGNTCYLWPQLPASNTHAHTISCRNTRSMLVAVCVHFFSLLHTCTNNTKHAEIPPVLTHTSLCMHTHTRSRIKVGQVDFSE